MILAPESQDELFIIQIKGVKYRIPKVAIVFTGNVAQREVQVLHI